ncbi:hypothetical protein IW140_006455 [Coemansia sp. RSA 1813]|nr:hypothetical protein EV178_006425 [Coemansia sp. RSA 1646]KAJ1765292.1 hypothetical protein LPJ74_006410 [Coemansia sp. RSA 1843]KAJ2085263.1 hypothetical protein IW138_006427 [Coemansia sp. RSA 986]KAJ2210276.1 hypothetical protein EV179_006350 [Coemansia sp. RSA 487]KAJ2562222.1 hypothetical protein IW140_006455 [Coemansia sp. RSA 1813]
MPELPDEKPASLRRDEAVRGRGGVPHGRIREKPTMPTTAPGNSAAGALPSQRLSSIRDRALPSASTSASGNSSATGPKMRFKPNIPARRNKKEASELLSDMPAVEVKQEHKDTKADSGRGRDGGRGRGRGRVELIQTVSGPFAQGPASLGGGSGARYRRSGAGGAFNMGILPPGVSGSGGSSSKGTTPTSATLANAPGGSISAMDTDDGFDLNNSNAPVCIVAENDENIQTDEFEVQTEEMAIQAMDEMRKLKLDYSVASAIGSVGGIKKEEKEAGQKDFEPHDKIFVFQLPAIPGFELGEKALQQRLAEKQRRIARRKEVTAATAASIAVLAATTISNGQVDVKPNVIDLAAEDPAVDVKPDIAALEEKENAKTEDDADGNEEDSQLDGRIGTLVVLKSGAVKMKIGDILLDVSNGASTQFLRGLLAVDMRGHNSAFMLGNIDEQLVCTPDLDSIL